MLFLYSRWVKPRIVLREVTSHPVWFGPKVFLGGRTFSAKAKTALSKLGWSFILALVSST